MHCAVTVRYGTLELKTYLHFSNKPVHFSTWSLEYRSSRKVRYANTCILVWRQLCFLHFAWRISKLKISLLTSIAAEPFDTLVNRLQANDASLTHVNLRNVNKEKSGLT